MTVIDFGIVKSSNEKKRKEIRKRRQLEMKKKTATELERKLDLEELARKKIIGFFKIKEYENNLLKKRKRKDNHKEIFEDNQSTKKQREDSLGERLLPKLQSLESHQKFPLSIPTGAKLEI